MTFTDDVLFSSVHLLYIYMMLRFVDTLVNTHDDVSPHFKRGLRRQMHLALRLLRGRVRSRSAIRRRRRLPEALGSRDVLLPHAPNLHTAAILRRSVTRRRSSVQSLLALSSAVALSTARATGVCDNNTFSWRFTPPPPP